MKRERKIETIFNRYNSDRVACVSFLEYVERGRRLFDKASLNYDNLDDYDECLDNVALVVVVALLSILDIIS